MIHSSCPMRLKVKGYTSIHGRKSFARLIHTVLKANRTFIGEQQQQKRTENHMMLDQQNSHSRGCYCSSVTRKKRKSKNMVFYIYIHHS